jgi:hypothetical protein
MDHQGRAGGAVYSATAQPWRDQCSALTKDQRDEHIRRYAGLLTERREVSGQVVVKPKFRPRSCSLWQRRSLDVGANRL